MSQLRRVKKTQSKTPAGAKPPGAETLQNASEKPRGKTLTERIAEAPRSTPSKPRPKSLFEKIKDGSAWNEDDMLPLLPPGERARLRARLHSIVGDPKDFSPPDADEGRAIIFTAMEAILADEAIALADDERPKLINQLGAEWIGLGPLQPLMDDDEVWAIFVYGPHSVHAVLPMWAVNRVSVHFEDEAHLARIIGRLAASASQRLDAQHPMAYFRLPDGSRITAFLPPLAVNGPILMLRKFGLGALTPQNLIDNGTVSIPELEFLRACVIAGLSILVCGGRVVGKTHLMNVLGGFIPQDEQITVIEQYDDLVLKQSAVSHLVYGGPGAERGFSLNDVLQLQHRSGPQRIIFSDVQGNEALTVLELMMRRSVLVDIQARSPEHALRHFEQLCLRNEGVEPDKLRRHLADAIALVVYIERLLDGRFRVTRISEVQGIEGDQIQLANLFRFEETGRDNIGRIKGTHKALGTRPGKRITDAIDWTGIILPDQIFGIS